MAGNLITRITIADKIKSEMKNFPEQDKKAIYDFIQHVKKNKSLEGLEGRNKESHNVNTQDPYYLDKVTYAITYRLWHYHIGIPFYDCTNEFGDRTSKYVLHYQLLDDEVRIVDYSEHPPFNLPTEKYLDFTDS